jgi:diacylglycerol kinase (ATP)
MSYVAVIAHAGKGPDGGLCELRRALERRGVDPLWREVAKSREAPHHIRHMLDKGAKLIFVWGGDGMVQRCVDTLVESEATMAIVPAGTANLLASNLGIPKDIDAAVKIGLWGARRRLDVASINGERFAVMAGIGFDARMIRDADRELKRVLGRLAYVWAATKNFRARPFKARVSIDGNEWFRGDASCLLFGNVGRVFGGIRAFDGARPDDGLLEVGVTTARGFIDWMRTIARSVFSTASKSPFVHVARGRSVEVKLNRKVLYELDGGDRTERKAFRIEIQPSAVKVCVSPGSA